jgi:hypothetical protein
VLLGDGAGTLYPAVNLSTSLLGPLAAVDLDGNNRADLAVSNYNSYNAEMALTIWLNTTP